MSDIQFGALMACIVAIMGCVTITFAIIFNRRTHVSTPMIKMETGEDYTPQTKLDRKRVPRNPGSSKGASKSEQPRISP